MFPKIAVLLLLAASSLADLRHRTLPPALAAAAGAAGLYYTLFVRADPPLRVLASFLPGLLILAVSRCTRGAIGTGDALCVFILGLFYTLLSVTLILVTALFIVFMTVIPLLALRKIRYADPLPFLPFLLAGFVCFLFFTA